MGKEGKLWFGGHGCGLVALSSNYDQALCGLAQSMGHRKSRHGGGMQQVEWLNFNLIS